MRTPGHRNIAHKEEADHWSSQEDSSDEEEKGRGQMIMFKSKSTAQKKLSSHIYMNLFCKQPVASPGIESFVILNQKYAEQSNMSCKTLRLSF